MKTRAIFLCIIAAILLVLPVSAYYPDSLYPIGGKYNATVPGERNAGQWYEWQIINVSGYADVKYHFTIYDAEIKDSYEYRSDAWGQWWTETPNPGKKFLFVWVCGWSEGTTWWGWGQDRFFAWVKGTTLKPEDVKYSDIGKVYRGGGSSNEVPPYTIKGFEDRITFPGFPNCGDEAYGYKEGIALERMEPAKSNAWSGYIIYQVPSDTKLKDIQIAGWFGYFGTAYWNLEPKPYIQQSPEFQVKKKQIQMQGEIQSGKRLPDRIQIQDKRRKI
jgi:hypothetical protein